MLQNQVWRLRRALAEGNGGADDRLAFRTPGYLLRVGPGELDVEEFGRLADQGRQALAAGDADIIGPERVRAEPEAAADLVRACAQLPLALRIAAANLAGEPASGPAPLHVAARPATLPAVHLP